MLLFHHKHFDSVHHTHEHREKSGCFYFITITWKVASYLHWVSRLTIAFKFSGETVTETKFVMFAMMASSIIELDRRVHIHQEIR